MKKAIALFSRLVARLLRTYLERANTGLISKRKCRRGESNGYQTKSTGTYFEIYVRFWHAEL